MSLGLSLITALTYIAGLKNEGLLSSAILVFLAIIPLGSMDNPALPENRQKLRNFTRIIILLVIIESMIAIWNETFTSPLFYIPLIGIVLYQWYANYTMIKE